MEGHSTDPVYTFGEDGIPTLVDDTSNPSSPLDSKPPTFSRKKVTEYSDTDTEDLKAVFTIEGEGYDAILSETKAKISLVPMSASGRRKSARKLSGLLRSRRSSLSDSPDDGIALSSLLGAHVKRRSAGVCSGIILSLLERKNANCLREKTLLMEHPSEELCVKWEERLLQFLRSKYKRPQSVKLFLQSYAGGKNGRPFFQKNILPLFHNANVSVDLSEVAHNEYIKQTLTHLNFEDYDCIACIGGDGTVGQTVDALMNRSQKEKDVDVRMGAPAAAAPIPLGIIPTGRTNHIAYSVMGTNDPVTGALHIIYGNSQPVDVCSIVDPDRICHWGFNSQYGFAGQVLTYLKRYKALGSKRVDASIIKALTKAKLRAYECDIEYIPVETQRRPEKVPCTTGCEVCLEVSNRHPSSELSTDMVQELDPLNESFTSNTSSVIDLPQDSPWKVLKGKYMNIGLFTLPGRSAMTPQGLSKYTHLCNGVIDLILVKETDKKEFVRHLKRHGNSKDQLDFPFVQVMKVKEVRFRPRFPMSWNYNDHDFSEIKYQMEREGSKVQNNDNLEVINDLERSNSVDTLDISDDEDISGEEEQQETRPQMLGPQYRKTFTEIEIERRRKIARKKEEKRKAREEAKMLSVWNVDNQQNKVLELDFKVHHGVLSICACGVSPLSDYEEVRTGCLS